DQSAEPAAHPLKPQLVGDILAVERQRELAQLRACGRCDLNQRVAAADHIGSRRQRFDLQSRGRLGKPLDTAEASQEPDRCKSYDGGLTSYKTQIRCNIHFSSLRARSA